MQFKGPLLVLGRAVSGSLSPKCSLHLEMLLQFRFCLVHGEFSKIDCLNCDPPLDVVDCVLCDNVYVNSDLYLSLFNLICLCLFSI